MYIDRYTALLILKFCTISLAYGLISYDYKTKIKSRRRVKEGNNIYEKRRQELVKAFMDCLLILLFFGLIHVFGCFLPTFRLHCRCYFQGVVFTILESYVPIKNNKIKQ